MPASTVPPGPPPPAPPLPAPPRLPVADLERRYYAHAVDRGLAWSSYAAVGGLAGWLLDDPLVVVALVLGWVLALQVALAVLLGLRGLSPGKALLGLRVVSERTGGPVGVAPALLRGLVVGLAGVPTLLLGAATLAWTSAADRDRRRRGWHDHLAGSVVVDLRPVPVSEEVEEVRPRSIVNLTAMRLMPTPQPAPTTPGTGTGTGTVSPAPAQPAAASSAPRPPGARRRAVPTDSPTAGPTAGPAPGPAPAPAGGWVVELDSGEQVAVEGLVLLGRGPVARAGEQVRRLVPLRSQDMSVSKTHAQLQVAPDGALVVMDRGSTNGSVVVRSGVARELAAGKPVTLLDGDVVRLGDRSLRVGRAR
ncbi:RDD family protein [Nocardioides sp. 31GB23]|uniref:RDD family protein n=1 Tax=Nocardioides sp. 31GB23 TaxID=3156065 RepID=UPI0032AF6108